MPDSLLASARVVMYEPQDHVNIAATVRAMKNMGVSELRLVRPVEYDPWRLEGIAHGTQDIVERIRHFDTIDEALADCVCVAAFTARRRAAKWRFVDPKTAAGELVSLAPEGPVALLFGPEDSGLPNDALARANMAVVIPTTQHSSLNLAQAALIGLYELHLAAADATRALPGPRKEAPPPTAQHYELAFADIERALATIEFFKTRYAEHIMRSARSLLFRAAPDARELSLVRAVAIEVVRFIARTGRVAGGADDAGDAGGAGGAGGARP